MDPEAELTDAELMVLALGAGRQLMSYVNRMRCNPQDVKKEVSEGYESLMMLILKTHAIEELQAAAAAGDQLAISSLRAIDDGRGYVMPCFFYNSEQFHCSVVSLDLPNVAKDHPVLRAGDNLVAAYGPFAPGQKIDISEDIMIEIENGQSWVVIEVTTPQLDPIKNPHPKLRPKDVS